MWKSNCFFVGAIDLPFVIFSWVVVLLTNHLEEVIYIMIFTIWFNVLLHQILLWRNRCNWMWLDFTLHWWKYINKCLSNQILHLERTFTFCERRNNTFLSLRSPTSPSCGKITLKPYKMERNHNFVLIDCFHRICH